MTDNNSDRQTAEQGGALAFVKAQAIGLVTAFLLSVMLLFVMALIFCAFEVTNTHLTVTTLVVTALGVMLAAFFAAKKTGHRGWLTGMVSGGLYIAILYMVSYLAFDTPSFTLKTPLMAVIGLAGGTFGGIFGVGGKKKYKR